MDMPVPGGPPGQPLRSAPMIPAPTDEDLAIQDSVRRFAASDLAPRAAEFDESEAFVGAHLPGLSALGIMGLNLPEEWGGAGASAAGLVGAVAEIARACAATASMVTAHFLASDAILLAGSAAQKRALSAGRRGGQDRSAPSPSPSRAPDPTPADMTTSAVAGRRLPSARHQAFHQQCRPCGFHHRLRPRAGCGARCR